jgi:hypothetical protein
MIVTDLHRVSPIQARAIQTLRQIEAAALHVLAECGRDRFTTSNVAEAAGCSIGTLYRYFPDRVALLDHIWPDRDMSVPGAVGSQIPVVGEHRTVTGVVEKVDLGAGKSSADLRTYVVSMKVEANEVADVMTARVDG